MGFSDELRAKAAPIWDKEKQHPFITGIGDGTLSLDRFRYYMRQDYIFLIDFCRAISLAVVKAQSVEDMGWFARLLHETLNTEMSLHVSFCQDFGITEKDLRSTEATPTTLAYTGYLVQTAFSGGVGEIASAILPCSWGYSEIGQMLHDRGAPQDQPLYTRWIDMYSAPEFAELAEWLRAFLDRSALASGEMERGRWRLSSIPAASTSTCFGMPHTRWRSGLFDGRLANSRPLTEKFTGCWGRDAPSIRRFQRLISMC